MERNFCSSKKLAISSTRAGVTFLMCLSLRRVLRFSATFSAWLRRTGSWKCTNSIFALAPTSASLKRWIQRFFELLPGIFNLLTLAAYASFHFQPLVLVLYLLFLLCQFLFCECV